MKLVQFTIFCGICVNNQQFVGLVIPKKKKIIGLVGSNSMTCHHIPRVLLFEEPNIRKH
jgi:hypothetical protein